MAEVRTTSSTGGQKGVKPQRYDLIPKQALDAISEVYAFGAEKYADHNWRRGYEWGKSYAALQRHLQAFWDGNTLDEESGLNHLAHAGFHVFALLTWFAEQGEGVDNPFDDRWPHGLERAKRAAEPEVIEANWLYVAPIPPKTNSEWVVRAARDLEESWTYNEDHPEEASTEWDIEYRQEVLEEAMRQYRENGADAEPVIEAKPLPDGWQEIGYVDETQVFGGDRAWEFLTPIIREIDERTLQEAMPGVVARYEALWAIPEHERPKFGVIQAVDVSSYLDEIRHYSEETARLLESLQVPEPRVFEVTYDGVIREQVVTEALQRFHNRG